jgi:hypothetical protein
MASHERYRSRDLGGSYASLARDLGGWSRRVEDRHGWPTQFCAHGDRQRRQGVSARLCSQDGALATRARDGEAEEWARREVADAEGGRIRPARPAGKPRRCWGAGGRATAAGFGGIPRIHGDLQLAGAVGRIVDFMDLANDYRADRGSIGHRPMASTTCGR